MLFYLRFSNAKLLAIQLAAALSARTSATGLKHIISDGTRNLSYTSAAKLNFINSSAQHYHTSTVSHSWFTPKKWDALLGPKDGTNQVIPQDVSKIMAEMRSIDSDIDQKINVPIADVINQHNKTISNIKAALETNKWLFINRTNLERTELVLKELEGIRDFYIEFKSSDKFKEMKSALFQKRVLASYNQLEVKINTLEQKNEHLLLQMNRTQNQIILSALNTQYRVIENDINKLKRYKDSFTQYPARLLTIEETVRNFLLTIECNVDVFNTVCDSLKLTVDLEKNGALSGVRIITLDIQNSWKDLETIVENLTSDIGLKIKREQKEIFDNHEKSAHDVSTTDTENSKDNKQSIVPKKKLK